MLSIEALLKFININNDNKIQKSEVEEFNKTQKSPSIFTEYFNSINSDTDLSEFADNLYRISEESNTNFELDFKNSEKEAEYNNILQEEINSFREECKFFIWKTSGEEEFNQLFDEFLEETGDLDEVWQKFETLEITKPIKIELINEAGLHSVNLPNDFSFSADIDWSNSREVLGYLAYSENTFANTPPEHLPEGYNPEEVMEKGKSIGLGIDEVHNMGFTGSGISYAIIDSGVAPHENLKFKEYNEPASIKDNNIHFHGSAVSYIAQEIAPDANCYYYATQNGWDMDAPVLENLKAILEKNKTLPDNEKIRFVSMSMPLYGGEEAEEIYKELEAQGVWVYYSGCPEDKNRGYLEKIDPMGDPNDFNNYQTANDKDAVLYVNSGDRTVPDPASPTAWRHDSRASQSWSIPVIAGYYTLACQADPKMTKERFLELAEQTAQVKQSTMPIYECIGDTNNEEDWVLAGRTEETREIKIIDINALIKAIEAQKAIDN